jgi:uncharacterized protein (DUF885 family)
VPISVNTQSDQSSAAEIATIGREFWEWRHRQAPATRDDICRVVRPRGWTAHWAAADVSDYRTQLAEFTARVDRLDVSALPVSDRVDARLLRSALARVRWELDDVRNWARNPSFYVEQSLGSVFELMLRRPPFDDGFVTELLGRLAAVPRILGAGRENLAGQAFREYADVAVGELDGIVATVTTAAEALCQHLPAASRAAVSEGFGVAGTALEEFAAWLAAGLAEMPAFEPLGREKFVGFLRDVACVSWSPEEIASIGRQEWRRAILMETLQARRNAGSLPSYVAQSADAQCAVEAEREQQVRDFYAQNGLLTIPGDLSHYLNLPMPEYLWPLRWLGVTDDLTDPHRLDENSVSYVPEPLPGLPYFHDTNAGDPRIGIVHEGAHAMQLGMSWAQPNELRREHYDSVANEGIAYYNEELMLHAGLFDDALHSRQVMYNLMRLRALRVNVDVDLVLGNLTLQQAGERLRDLVPMDETTAFAEAASFASTPGLGLSYVTGKQQIFDWIADDSVTMGSDFDLAALHDFLWRNGNVPIELVRLEYSELRATAGTRGRRA